MRTVVDTSSWIELFRPKGREVVKNKTAELMYSGRAVLNPIILLELWNGVCGDHETELIRELEETVPVLPIDGEVWIKANRLAVLARKKGVTAPASDIAIVACARHHGADLEHCDKHLDVLWKISS